MTYLLKFYLAIFFRRIHYFLVIFLLVVTASITIARVLPAVYVSEAHLQVESAQIPDALAQSTVITGATEQLQIVEQRLMTRSNMLDVARRMNVFDDIATMTADQIVSQMRSKTSIERQGGRNQATFMTISFEARDGQTAANVTNEFVTLILEVNAEMRASRAGETLAFFELEVERLGNELQRQGAVILEFKSRNSDALPDSMDFRLNQQSLMQERLSSVEREISALKEQKIRLVQMFEATGRVRNVPAEDRTSEEIQLARLQEELSAALALLSPENPKVKLLQAQVSQLEASVARQVGSGALNSSTGASILDIQLADIDARIGLLSRQAAQISSEIDVLVDSLDRTLANSITLGALERDYENVQTQYNTSVDRVAKAATGERIELLSKGQRILILEAATVPNEPAKPNRKRIVAAGIAAGAALGFAFIALLEMLNNAVMRPSDITKHLGITPIATIPYIRTPMEMVMKRAALVLVFAFVVIGVPALLYAVHVYYLPLDLIYDRVAGQFGRFL